MKTLFTVVIATLLMFVIVPIPASATNITFNDAFGSHATFAVINVNQLEVTLWTDRNVMNNAQVLTALFFDISGTPSLAPLSATVPVKSATDGTTNNSFLYIGGTNYGFTTPLNVAGEWTYKSGLSLPGGGTYGISSSGFGLFGPSDLFPGGSDLNPVTTGPDGGDFGLIGLSAAGPSNPGYDLLVKNTTVFVLSGLPAVFDPSANIVDPFFQYGTTIGQVPEPTTMLLLGIGLIGLWGARRKRKN